MDSVTRIPGVNSITYRRYALRRGLANVCYLCAVERTAPHLLLERTLPVRTLRVEVVEGPDAGRTFVASSERATVGTAAGNDLVLADATVSRFHLELSVRSDGVQAVDHESTNGTYVGNTRIERGVLARGTLLRVGRSTLRIEEAGDAAVELHDEDALAGLRGRSPKMRRLMAQITRAAASDASVLLFGESGTGKELVARALAEVGPRRRGPFVTVDCGSLSPTLVASELFGHERGAFTGADRQHVGAFEEAHGGTIFLDEIGELPAQLQSTLLGVLERRRFRRLGGKADIAFDARVVSATHRDLRAEVNRGTFRLDLYYRLAVVVLEVPSLRERAEDIPVLLRHFAREVDHDGPIEQLFPPERMLELMAHRWPGNVRELRNLVEAAVAMGEAPLVGLAPTPPGDGGAGGDTFARLLSLPYKDARAALLHEFEATYLRECLSRAGGNVARAARETKIDRSHLNALLQRHGLR
jgi:DNA-binding NtrC family response regulator